MSLFTNLILPTLAQEIRALEPEIAQFVLTQLKKVANEVVEWAEMQLNADINGDGEIGVPKDESN